MFGAWLELVCASKPMGLCRVELRVGDAVAQLSYDGFSDYAVVPTKQALLVPVLAPEVLALLTSGLTASIGARYSMVWPLIGVATHMGVLSTRSQLSGLHQAPMSWYSLS